jgi:hypothetical protein
VSDWLQKLSLVVATAFAGFLLGPYLTNKWQNHQENLDTRSALVERISNAVGKFVGAAQVEAHRTQSAQSAFDASFVQWQIDSEAIYTQIEAYVDGASAASEWSNYAYDMMWVYYVFKRDGAVRTEYALRRVAAYLGRPLSTLDGLIKAAPFLPDGRVHPTHESALRELVLQLRIKERAIISHILRPS